MLLYVAFFLGMAGSSFAVGVGFVSRWFPPEKQGGALGIYGLGNIGQSAAVFVGPVLAVVVGWQNIFRGMAALLVIWGIGFFLLARNSPKTVRQYFPKEVGTVTGLVGAMGGLGGFFPPLLLGFFRDHLHAVWPGFALLALLCVVLWRTNAVVFLAKQQTTELSLPASLRRTADRIRAGVTATFFTGLLVAAIVVGSRKLQNFDPALVVYTFATIFATWGVVYHYRVWLDKPPTRMYWERGWQLFREAGIFRGTVRLLRLAATHLAAQTFILRRSALRWWMHQMLFWGCILAVAITFPLVFGWISFQSLPTDQETYVVMLYGFPTQTFRLHTLFAELLFHGLDVSAILVLGGIALSLWRRFRDRGAQAVQSFTLDFLPII